MIVYELTHLFFRNAGELILSPKKLGFFFSADSISRAVQYYSSQPGFCISQDAFSVRERNVLGAVEANSIFEAIIYFHSANYEYEIELGLYADEITAQNKINKYCSDNASLIDVEELALEPIINKCVIERKEWQEGFSISESWQ